MLAPESLKQKAYYEIWAEMKTCPFQCFYIIKVMIKCPSYHHLSVYILLALHKIEIFWINFPIQYYSMRFTRISEIADPVITTTQIACFPIHKILSFLNVLLIYVNNRKLIGKNVHRLLSKSCNIALNCWLWN